MCYREVIDKLGSCVGLDEQRRFLDAYFSNNKKWEHDQSIDDAVACVGVLIKSVSLPCDKYGDNEPNDKDAKNSCDYASSICAIITQILSNFPEFDEVKEQCKELLPVILTLCAPLLIHINPWSNRSSDSASKELLKSVSRLYGVTDFVGEKIDQEWIFKDTLEAICPHLIGEKWKESSMARLSFIYLITNTVGEILEEYLDKILPVALTLTDDYTPRHTSSGIKCVHHILNEVSPAEIRLRGRADVLHDALSRKIYTRDPVIAKVLLPCLLRSLECIETDMMKRRGCRIPKHDECFDGLLNNFHLTSEYAVKRMGIQSIGHMKTILIVVEYGFETADLIMIPLLCNVITELVNVAWLRMSGHAEKFLEILVKTLYSVTTDEWRSGFASKESTSEATESIIEAIAKLGTIAKDLVVETQVMMEEEKSLCLNESALSLKRLLTESTTSHNA